MYAIPPETKVTLFDTILLVIALAAVVVGWRKGLVRQVASLARWVAGIIVTLLLGDRITRLFLTLNPDAASWPLASVTVKAVALSITFLLITLALRLFSASLRSLTRAAGLGTLDRLGGAALFAFKYVFLLSVGLNLLMAYRPNADTFATMHALGNAPYEFTINLMPRVLGADRMPADSLALYRLPTQPLPATTQ